MNCLLVGEDSTTLADERDLLTTACAPLLGISIIDINGLSHAAVIIEKIVESLISAVHASSISINGREATTVAEGIRLVLLLLLARTIIEPVSKCEFSQNIVKRIRRATERHSFGNAYAIRVHSGPQRYDMAGAADGQWEPGENMRIGIRWSDLHVHFK